MQHMKDVAFHSASQQSTSYSGQTDLRGTMHTLRETGIRNVASGENVVIYQPANLYDCTLGDNVFVGPFVEIQGHTRIGATVKFSPIPLSASTSPSASAVLSVTA
jgi:bifunctional N-acetylglucosamine-1-phosphate-uridyltransferase/glucosamine-1-phosphate-acetyltransferase GlmU-like protein